VTEWAAAVVSTPTVSGRRRSVAVTLALSAALSIIAFRVVADPPPNTHASPPPSPDARLPQVTIQAEREALEQHVRAFISGDFHDLYLESLTRWNTAICPLVVGLPPSQADTFRARLIEIATAAGAQMVRQPCEANFAVIASASPNEVLRAWYKHDYHLFGDATQLRIKMFLDGPEPIRVWYNTTHKVANALPYTTTIAGLSVKGNPNIAVNNHAEPSRIVSNEIRSFASVVVVIDTGRTQDVSLNLLADYVAMVGLAEIEHNMDVSSAPTVLRLFSTSDQSSPSGLSAWDTAFLRALYRTDQRTVLQRYWIMQSMVQDISP
jgi:hypothetical protein